MSIPRSSLRQLRADPDAEAGDGAEELAEVRALIEQASDAGVVLDCDAGRFTSVNAAAEQLFGMDGARLLRLGPGRVSPPRQPDGRPSDQAAQAHIQQALAGGRPRFEWIHRRADGTDVPCEITLRLPSADQRLVRGSIVDITERRAAETARRTRRRGTGGRRVTAAGSSYGTISSVPTLRIAQDPAADELLSRDPLALLLGMMPDQHMRPRSTEALISGVAISCLR